ncbi:MAG: DUF1836 domain-containing protein [Clostridia bacterium]|nr:DUF1836 domain-containing protein [Clostridia bacterium]
MWTDNVICLPEWEQLPDIGLYMDQIMTLMDRVFAVKFPKGELTKAMINNYVKAGLLPRPSGKKYEREHLARILMIYILKQSLNMEGIGTILNMLCRDGAQAGYGRFRSLLEELENVLAQGKVEMDWTADSREEMTLRLGLVGALCTIRTYWILPKPGEKQQS